MKAEVLRGVFPATITPFTNQNELDLEGYRSHLQFLAEAGVHGFVPCGTTGEAPTLSDEEWLQVIRITKAEADKHGLVTIAGCGGNATDKLLTKFEKLDLLGCDAALVVTPYYNRPNQEGLIAHYRKLADSVKTPIILYNVPARTGVCLNTDSLCKLFEHPQIIGVKEATGDHGQWVDLASRVSFDTVSVFAGDDNAVATLMGLGGCGVISTSANVAPKQFVDLYNAAHTGDYSTAFELQKKLNRLIRALFSEPNPTPAKLALSLMSDLNAKPRLPLVQAGQKTQIELQTALQELGILT